MRAVIFTGGVCASDVTIPGYDICIAADSGFHKARQQNVFPDLIVGDFDSIGDEMPVEYTDESTGRRSEIIRHPVQKNETDTMLAVQIAIERGATELYIIGGLGGRADHTLSNVFLLESIADMGVSVVYTDGANELRVVTGGECVYIPHGEYRYFSTLALDECVISAVGCAYPLDRSTLTRANAYAVSNETLPGGATVTCHEGKLLLVRSEKL